MNLTCIFFGIIFTIAGFMFACGKGHIHFSSWKNMPQEEKEKIKIVPLCRNIGEVIALNGLIFLLKGLWTGFENHWSLPPCFAIIFYNIDHFSRYTKDQIPPQ